MKKLANIALIVLLTGSAALADVSLKKIRSIGDSRDEYTFFIISDAVMADNGDFYVLDGKGKFLSKFDQNGGFVKKIGQKGQGPGDFNSPAGLDLWNGQLAVTDFVNRRVFLCDLNLENFRYAPMNVNAISNQKTFILPGNRLMNPVMMVSREFRRIVVFDLGGQIVNHFFDEFPVPVPVDPRLLATDTDTMKAARNVIITQEAMPVIAVAPDRSAIYVSFRNPANPVLFYILTPDGKTAKTFSHALDPKYRFFDLHIRMKDPSDLDEKNYPDRYFKPQVSAMGVWKDWFMAQINLQEYHKTRVAAEERRLVVFSRDGRLTGSVKLEEEEYFCGVFAAGTVLTSRIVGDECKLNVYQLTQ